MLPAPIGAELYQAMVELRREEARRAGGGRPPRSTRRVRRALGVRLVNSGLWLIGGESKVGAPRIGVEGR